MVAIDEEVVKARGFIRRKRNEAIIFLEISNTGYNRVALYYPGKDAHYSVLESKRVAQNRSDTFSLYYGKELKKAVEMFYSSETYFNIDKN